MTRRSRRGSCAVARGRSSAHGMQISVHEQPLTFGTCGGQLWGSGSDCRQQGSSNSVETPRGSRPHTHRPELDVQGWDLDEKGWCRKRHWPWSRTSMSEAGPGRARPGSEAQISAPRQKTRPEPPMFVQLRADAGQSSADPPWTSHICPTPGAQQSWPPQAYPTHRHTHRHARDLKLYATYVRIPC